MAIRMTSKEYQKLTASLKVDSDKKKSKFHNEKVKDGEKLFDSQGEYDRYKYLCMLEKAGEITNLTFHEEHLILLSTPCIKYIPDFCYMENGIKILEDFKGVQTKEFILKKKMIVSMIMRGADFSFRIVKKKSKDSYEVCEEYFPEEKKFAHIWKQVADGVKWCSICGALCDVHGTSIPEKSNCCGL